MKLSHLLLLTLTFCLSPAPSGQAAEVPILNPKQEKKAVVGTVYRVQLKQLQATQSGVGSIQVDYRVKKIKKMNETELQEYVAKKVGRVVIRNGTLYLIDGNHMANAMHRAGQASMLATLVEVFPQISQAQFEKEMIAKKYCYLENEGRAGLVELRQTLKKKVVELPDFPTRSLAWGVREVGGFEDTDQDYAEFRWAKYFEAKFKAANLPLSLISTDTKQAIREALKFAHLAEASDLPGYKREADYTPEKVEKKLKKLFDEG